MSKLKFRYGQTSPTALGIGQKQGIWIRLPFLLDKHSLTPYYSRAAAARVRPAFPGRSL